ncbi:MAG: hypothetical protein FJ405_01240 [Verrucomicrobia bacterium]|nr:hypothetical protein [Verrucomicrobiota bacterium]
MKQLIAWVGCFLVLVATSHSQGFVIVANVSQDLTQEKPVRNVATGQPVGADYRVQLFAGNSTAVESQLQSIGDSKVFFESGGLITGIFYMGMTVIPGVSGGARASLQVRAWPASFNTWELAYQAAPNDPQIHLGKSSIVRLHLGYKERTAPELVHFMTQFDVAPIPEPSGIAFACSGFLSILLMFRWGPRSSRPSI